MCRIVITMWAQNIKKLLAVHYFQDFINFILKLRWIYSGLQHVLTPIINFDIFWKYRIDSCLEKAQYCWYASIYTCMALRAYTVHAKLLRGSRYRGRCCHHILSPWCSTYYGSYSDPLFQQLTVLMFWWDATDMYCHVISYIWFLGKSWLIITVVVVAAKMIR